MYASQPPQINLLSHEDNAQPKGRKIFRISRFMFYLGIVVLLVFFIFSYEVLFTNSSLTNALGGFSLFHQLTTLASGEKPLAGAAEDRINVLLMGIGGLGHDGPYLTDTLIVASFQPSTKKVAMISIPRDLLVDIPGHGWWKINNANHFGEKDNPGHGGELASQVVSQNLGIPIHYYIRIDFNGFEKVIDDLGGIKVYVDRRFTDAEYPTLDDKYQVISFDAGWQTMDGDTALKYVRSRHGNNGEGSDFARSKRQQKVLQAFKERVMAYNTLLNPKKLSKLISAFGEHVQTSMELADVMALGKIAQTSDTQNIITTVLDDAPTGYLFASKVNEAYVLQPRGGNFGQIQFMAQNIFQSQHTIAAAKTTATLEIKNGTTIPNLAYTYSEKMKTLGYKVLKIGNAPSQDYTHNVIYFLGESMNTETANVLKSQFKTEVERDVPPMIRNDADLSTDFYIVLGTDAQN
jgi:LCP family protein required for cell wall assembly